jgi:hypothetical protein
LERQIRRRIAQFRGVCCEGNCKSLDVLARARLNKIDIKCHAR